KVELAMAGAQERIDHAHAGEDTRFLLEQGGDRARSLAGILDLDETYRAVLGERAQLPPLALAGRRGALGRVERLPVARQVGDVGSAWVFAHGKVDEGISLLADLLRHLLEVDEIEAQALLGLQQRDCLAPRQQEAFRTHMRAEATRDERSVVVAQRRAEPDQ